MKENKRVIKFRRAYFKDENKKEFSHFSEWGVNVGQTSFTSPAQNNFAFYFEDCQFTGLLDKQGKEIYEGDVFKEVIPSMSIEKFTGEQECFVIIWDEKYAAFAVKRQSRDENEEIYKDWMAEIEIIGNVFSNPELLTPPTSKP